MTGLFARAALVALLLLPLIPASQRGEQRRSDSALPAPITQSPGRGDLPLVFTRIDSNDGNGDLPSPAEGIFIPDPFDRASVFRRRTDGRMVNLTADFHSACDPTVSFDGRRILFAGRRTQKDNWDIYEIGIDGDGLRQITRNLGNCRSPVYLSTLYTLISEAPWHQIAFSSDRAGTSGEYGAHPVTAIYSCRMDGGGLMRLTHGPSGETDPYLMRDGRLLFSAWRRRYLDREARLAIFAVNIDGADMSLFADAEGARHKRLTCVTSNGLAVFVETDLPGAASAGTLACVNLRRNLHSYRRITSPAQGTFCYPSPAPDGRVLVSHRPAGNSGRYGIHLLDPASGELISVLESKDHDYLQARHLAPRPEPDGRSTSVLRRTGEIEDPSALEPRQSRPGTEGMPLGKLYCLNIYNSDRVRPEWRSQGGIRRIRVLEGLPRPAMNLPGSPGKEVAQAWPPLLPRRFLGEAPVEDDGSFNIEIPADIPVELQLLDADGLALESCAWIWVKNNEPRGCIGCHEDPELAPENRLVKAVAKPAVELTLPPSRRRHSTFREDIMPIISGRCASCHGPGGAAPLLDGVTLAGSTVNRAYAGLVGAGERKEGESSRGGGYVTPGRARTSPLIWRIFGRDDSGRPFPATAAGSSGGATAESHGGLNPEEKRMFAEWIDTGAHWEQPPGLEKSTSGSNRSRGRK